MFIVAGNRRIAPSKSVISPMPAGLDGTVRPEGRGTGGRRARRMHSAIRHAASTASAREGCVVVPGTGGPPPGRSFRHFACAALNAGASGLVPAGESEVALCLRARVREVRHAVGAHAPGERERPRRGLAPGAVEPELVAAAAGGEARPSGGRRAPLPAIDAEVLGLPELPPQPATRTPLTSAATASRRARRERVGRFRWMLVRIWSPSGVLSGVPSVLRGSRFPHGFTPRRPEAACAPRPMKPP